MPSTTSNLLFSVLLISLCVVVAFSFEMTGSFAKLYFRHGAVSSAKTLNLLAVAHAYKVQGKSVLVMKVSVSLSFLLFS